MSDSENDLLSALEAHGRAFLASFDLPSTSTAAQKDSKRERKRKRAQADEGDADEEEWEEWHGIGGGVDTEGNDDQDEGREDRGDEDDSGDEDEDLDQEGSGDDDMNDDEFTSAQPTVVTFTDPSASAPMRAPSKAFMSSKVSKLRTDGPIASTSRNASKAEDDGDDEHTNAQNDALLHRLVHTQLLDPNLSNDSKPSARRTALLGRLHELASASGAAGKSTLKQSRPGMGSKVIKTTERNVHAKAVREGLLRKQKELAARKVEEAKELGTYHPSLKRALGATDEELVAKEGVRRRERGLKMGVGKFKGGVLRLGREDIARVEGRGEGGGRGGGRGGRGGRGRGRGGGRGKRR
ncbi:uncharacterized protein SCHCODRAFT_02730497 [Schizophyllum commune H4-8]|uniref:uncharacterized protein n=1 Tax=Schizophyllum commune (strain H4-8 / FGSC 9210) TaxID=578458 RepID=UPI00215FBE01|nr:uncharacterized protein SCHCODRAFT_02730497 [Schizophyllum commune H4-8]KAI5893771.1 hypothetical protein SCHCODRAFT_02730497 [Schizophyllum commune H4-8]